MATSVRIDVHALARASTGLNWRGEKRCFVVDSDRAQLSEIVRRLREGRLHTNIGNISSLDDAAAAFNPTKRRTGKTIICVRP